MTIPLPPWVPRDLWDEYCAQRKKDKKEMTPRSAQGRLKELYALRDAGHDVAYCMEAAINGHWLGFYAAKPPEVPFVATKQTNEWLAQYAEHAKASQSPEAHEARRRAMEAVRRG